jgi:hypothetical protein
MDRVKKMVHYWCDDIKKAGLTGKGVTVAVLDTGLAPHPDFKSRVVGWRDCIYRKEKLICLKSMPSPLTPTPMAITRSPSAWVKRSATA